jgi:CDP-diacylglycerol---serine O-phosphatidyltransferase
MKRIPNFITSLNLFSGFVSVIFAASGDIVTGSWLILAAMVFDFLDGLSARLLKAYSEIGKELDSLADVVSFGVAPAMIIHVLLNRSFSADFPAINDHEYIRNSIILLIPAIMPVCAALRLAVFNTDTTQSVIFKGLPTPANALAVISLIIAEHYSGSSFPGTLTGSPLFLAILTVLLSLLMVSRFPLLSLKFANMGLKGNEGRYLLIVLAVAAFIIFGINAAPLIIPFYLISSFLSLLF